MVKDEYYRMAEVESTHWWYRSLHFLVLKHIKKHFSSRKIKIIDAGCGTGGLMSFLIGRGYRDIHGFDVSDVAVKFCQDNNLSVFKGNLKNISDYFQEEDADVIISNDTFYFLSIDEQRKLADDIYRVLRKGGVLIANMPALKTFGGIHDLQVGIKRRFEREDIGRVFDGNKYALLTKTFWPLALSPVIWLSRYVQRLKMKLNPDTRIISDLKNEGKIINSMLFSITKAENQILSKKPFGSSLFLVMKK